MDQKKQFIYVLKLKPEFLDEKNWTKEHEQILDEHFRSLQNLLSEGKLVLAGRTQSLDEHTFGIVILEVNSEDEAVYLMQNDPAVLYGIMTAVIFPYKIALMRSQQESSCLGSITEITYCIP